MPKGTRDKSGVILIGGAWEPNGEPSKWVGRTTAYKAVKGGEISLSAARGIVGDARLKKGFNDIKMKQRSSDPKAEWSSTVVYSNSSKKATPKKKK